MKRARRPRILFHAFALLVLVSWRTAVADEPDRLSPPIVWRTPDGLYAAPIHATLLPDGRVLCIGSQRDAFDPSQATFADKIAFVFEPPPLGQPAPKEIVVTPLAPNLEADPFVEWPIYVQDDLVCSGHTIDAWGRVFTAGGTRFVADLQQGTVVVLGIPYGTITDGERWGRTKEMAGVGASGMPGRWYPTCTRLADGRILVTGGFSAVDPPLPFPSVEVFDPVAKSYQVLAGQKQTPFEIFNSDYTHVFVTPSGFGPFDTVMIGEFGLPYLFSTALGQFVGPGPQRPSAAATPNLGASSVLLPIRLVDGKWGYANGSFLVAGGDGGSIAGLSADVFDPAAGTWSFHRFLGSKRHHPSTVLLPDARVLVVAGHDDQGSPEVRRALYIDPKNGFSVEPGRSFDDAVRGYHSVTLLLPDGRVLVGGGQDGQTFLTTERPDFRLLAPSYVAADRPQIAGVPGDVQRGVPFAFLADRPLQEVAIVGLGSMTHSFDTSQRHVQLAIVDQAHLPGGVVVWAVVPDERAAPPGPYLLFGIDDQRIPSEGSLVGVH